MEFLAQPAGSKRRGDWLKSNLTGNWDEFRTAIAFVKRSGVKHIAPDLAEFAKSGRVEIIVGIDHLGTSYEGLKELLDAVSQNGRVIIFHNKLPHTFHPKVYLFKSSGWAEAVVGSGNLTQGGLFTNYEAGLQVTLDLSDETQRGILDGIEEVLDEWKAGSGGTSLELSHSNLEELHQTGLVPKEADLPKEGLDHSQAATDNDSSGQKVRTTHFHPISVPPAPTMPSSGMAKNTVTSGSDQHFVMTLQKTDVSVGQSTPGTSKRSPEIFIPLKARNTQPEFWNWPDGFQHDPTHTGKSDRKGVRMRVGSKIVEVRMMTWPVKHDFRLRSEELRSLGQIDDILVIQKVNQGAFEYDVKVVKPGESEYKSMMKKCDQNVPNSRKKFGYF